jgi:hypothetical protein
MRLYWRYGAIAPLEPLVIHDISNTIVLQITIQSPMVNLLFTLATYLLIEVYKSNGRSQSIIILQCHNKEDVSRLCGSL